MLGLSIWVIGEMIQCSSYRFGQFVAGRFIAGFGEFEFPLSFFLRFLWYVQLWRCISVYRGFLWLFNQLLRVPLENAVN